MFVLFQIDIIAVIFILLFGVIIYTIQKLKWLENLADKGVGCLAVVFNIFGFGLILVILLSLLFKQCDSSSDTSYSPPNFVKDDTESTSEKIIFKGRDSIRFVKNDSLIDASKLDTLITHKRVWYDFNRRKLEINLSVKKSDINTAYFLRESYQNYSSNFGDIYKDMSKSNDSMLLFVYHELDLLKQEQKFTDQEFFEAIVSMVQDIPYRLILSKDCENASRVSQNASSFLSTCKSKCCLGNIRFGFQSPVEFIGNLYGDCDTRTVLLYTLLKHYNYDVVILNSRQYAHSILGVSSSYYSGTYISGKLKKYYFIETTNVGFYPGTINPELGNINLWKIVTH